jgi:autotransporter translocation and assembly factor TamB
VSDPTATKRRPGRLRRWVVRPFVWGVLFLAALIAGTLLFVQSRYARQQLAARMVAAVSEKMGRKVQVGDLDFTFLPPAVELRDVVIPGPRPSDPAVARVPLARVQASWSDLRRRVLRLEQIEAIRPEIHLQFNSDGTNNLPGWKTDSPSGPRRFEVQIGRILVQDGTLHLNELHVPMSIDAKAVWGRITGRADRRGEGGDRLDMLVTAQEVVTALPSARPYAATVSAKGSLDPQAGQIRIAAARIAGPDLHADVDGLIDWRSEPHRVALRVDGRGDARWVNRVGYMEEPIDGPVTFRGRVDVQGTESLYTSTVRSPRIAILHRVFRDVEGQLAGGNDGLRFDIARAGYADGRAQGRVTVDWADQEHRGIPVGLDLNLSGMNIQPLIHDQFPDQKIPVVDGLAGTVSGRFRYLFEHAAAIAGDGTAALRIEAVDRGSGLPIAGTAPVDIRAGVLSSDAIRLTAPGQVLAVDGFTFDLQKTTGKLAYRLDSSDLGKVAPLLLQDSPRGEPPPFWLPTAGQGVVTGDLAIDHTDYVAHMSLDLQNALAGITSGTRVDTARGSLTLRPTAVDDLRIALASQGADLTVSGRVPLAAEGKARAAAPMALAVDAHGWPAAGVAAFLLPPDAAAAWPITGQVTGRLDLGGWAGGPGEPNNLNGRAVFTVAGLAVRGIALGRLQGTVAFEGARVRIEQAVAETPAGNVRVAGAFDGTQLSFNLDAPQLSLAAEPFRDALGGRLAGRMSVAAVVGGTVDRPEMTVRVLGSDLALDGRVLGNQEGKEPAGTAQALLSWDGRSLQATGSLLGLVAFDGGGRLDTAQADLTFDVRSDALGALAQLAAPQPLPDFKGSFAGTVGLTADFARQAWRGELVLGDLRAQYQGHAIANREPVVVDLLPDRLEIRSLYLGEPKTESELFASGTIGLGGGKVPLDLKFQSTLSAAWAGLFLPNVQVEGFLDLLASVRGTLDDPVLNGQGELRQGRLVLPQLSQELANIQGVVFFNRNGIEVEGVRADMGGGKLQASGRVSLPRPGEALSYRLQVAATGISLRYPEGFLVRGDADLALVSTPQSRVIRGEVRLDRLFYLEDVKLGTLDLLRRLLQRQRLEVAQTDPFLTSTQLNVQINGPEALRVNNNIAKLRGDVDLSVQGTLANPILFGRVELEPGGTLVYSDNEYELERGLLTFNNPYRIDPVIDFVARTQVRSYDISLSLSGTLDRLSAKFSSDEGLADLEVLALLATGQELQGTGRLQAPGERTDADSGSNVGASTFLAGQAASLVSERVGSLFGFDRFRIDPLAGSTGAIGGVRLTVGKRISKNLLVTYSSNPAASEEYLVRAEWQVADNLVLVFTRDGKLNNYALDAEWEKRF